MEPYTTKPKQKRNVEAVNFYVLPEERKKIVEKAQQENRSISNFVKSKVMEALS